MERLSKFAFVISVVIFVLGGSFFFGAFAQRNNLPPIPQLDEVYRLMTDGSERPTVLPFDFRYSHLQPERGQGNGVIVNTAGDDGNLIFMGGFFDNENQLRLVRRDGSVVRKWSLNYLKEFPDPERRYCGIRDPLGTDTHGAHLTPEGEVVYVYEYCGAVKLDQCGNVVWALDQGVHHGLVPAQGGGYWTMGEFLWEAASDQDRFYPFSRLVADESYDRLELPSRPYRLRHVHEDTVLRLSDNGEVLEEFSIPELMRDNGLMGLMTVRDIGRPELVHANKVTELSEDLAAAFPLFEAGDLAISMRSLNLIMVIDPKTKRVKWHQTGPWIRQHDPEFLPDGRISIYNNNTYRRTAYQGEHTILSTPPTTNIIAIDPVTRETEILFGERAGEEMLSVLRGEHEVLDDGGMIMAEFDGGRIIEINADREIIWEYVNGYDEEWVGEITNVNRFSESYFTTPWPTCE